MLFKSLTETRKRLRGQDSHIRLFNLQYLDTWTGNQKVIGAYIINERILITDYVTDELEAIVHQKLTPLIQSA